jgi:hypothetical protein
MVVTPADDNSRLRISLRRDMAGHVCGIHGALSRVSQNVFEAKAEDVGCDVLLALFRNGVILWEDGSCSGVRATCTDVYTDDSRDG